MVTQDQLKALFEYRDGGLYWCVSPTNSVRVGARAGALRHDGYRQVFIDGKKYFEHRLIHLLRHGYLPEFLDHINGDKADNRVENLRACTLAENQHNSKTPRNNTSGAKGVSWHKAGRKWQARIAIDGKCTYLGYFSNIEEAKVVVDAARAKHHGEFARC